MSEPEINKDAMSKVVTALRSGKYRKGKGVLHPTPETHCCLGVMCEVAKQEGIIQYYHHSNGTLPGAVVNWLGFYSNNPKMRIPKWKIFEHYGNRTDIDLANLNDHTRINFRQMASLLEREFLSKDG